jgi:hypothetical protein
MSLETKKQLREVLVATGTSSSVSPSPLSLPLLLFRIGNVQTTARKRKSLTATKAQESNFPKEQICGLPRGTQFLLRGKLAYARV